MVTGFIGFQYTTEMKIYDIDYVFPQNKRYQQPGKKHLCFNGNANR